MAFGVGSPPMRAAILLVLSVVVLASCNDARKLQRILGRHPEWRDTVLVYDTVEAIVEYVRHDTLFVSVPGDTVRVDDGRLHIRYVRLPGDTVYLRGECDPDTAKKIVPTITQQINPTQDVTKEVIPWWVIAALLVALGLSAVTAIHSLVKR